MYLWTKNRLDMRLKLKAYGKFGGFVHFPDVKSAETWWHVWTAPSAGSTVIQGTYNRWKTKHKWFYCRADCISITLSTHAERMAQIKL